MSLITYRRCSACLLGAFVSFISLVAQAGEACSHPNQSGGSSKLSCNAAIVVSISGKAIGLGGGVFRELQVGDAIYPGRIIRLDKRSWVEIVYPNASLVSTKIRGPTDYKVSDLEATISTQFEFAHGRVEGFNLRSPQEINPFKLPGKTNIASDIMQLDFSDQWKSTAGSVLTLRQRGKVVETISLDSPLVQISRYQLEDPNEAALWCVLEIGGCTLRGKFKFLDSIAKEEIESSMEIIQAMEDPSGFKWMLKVAELIESELYLDAAAMLATEVSRHRSELARNWLTRLEAKMRRLNRSEID